MSEIYLLKHSKLQTPKTMSRCEPYNRCSTCSCATHGIEMAHAHYVGIEDIHHHHTKIS